MEQSRLGSFYEACINTVIGFTINYIANLLIFPLFGWSVGLGENFLLGLLYTGISVARSYVVRRWFNARLRRAARRLAGEA